MKNGLWKCCNRVIGALDEEELGLFRERIKFLDKRIHPGLTKLNWAQSLSDFYINDCRLNAGKVRLLAVCVVMVGHNLFLFSVLIYYIFFFTCMKNCECVMTKC